MSPSPSSFRYKLTVASALLALVVPAVASAQGLCHLAGGGPISDSPGDVEAVEWACPDRRVRAERGRFHGAQLRELIGATLEIDGLLVEAARVDVEDGDALTAHDACLTIESASDTALRLCADTLRRSEGRWHFREGEVRTASGARLLVEDGSCAAEGCSFARAAARLGVTLPYPARRLDAHGRTSGLSHLAVGYRTDREGTLATRWYLPFSGGADISVGVFGHTVGAVGASADLRWRRPGYTASRITVTPFYDGSRDDSLRLAFRGIAAGFEDDGQGLALQGHLVTDPLVDQDLAEHSLERLRIDRTVAAAAWSGFDWGRVWMGARGRQWTRQVAPRSGSDTLDSTLSFSGSVPSAGIESAVFFSDVAMLSNRISFDRWVLYNAGPMHSVSAARLVSGGQLHLLRFPGLSLVPGLWVDLGARFGEPDGGSSFNQFTTRLLATGELSSAWIGGSRTLQHTIELRAVGAVEAFRETYSEGTAPSGQVPPQRAVPRALDVGLWQSVRTAGLTVHLPLRWVLVGDDHDDPHHRVVSQLSLATQGERAGLELGQLLAIDTRRGGFGSWRGFVDARFGRPASGGLSGGLGANLLLRDSTEPVGADFIVSPLPALSRVPLSRPAEARDLLQVSARIASDEFGLASSLSFPLGLDGAVDTHTHAWLGASGGPRAEVRFGYLSDETVVVSAGLTHDL